MDARKKYRIFVITFTIVITLCMIKAAEVYIENKIPDDIYILENDETTVDFDLPINVSVSNNNFITSSNVSYIYDDSLKIKSGNSGNYELNVTAFGLWKIKTVNINVINENQLIPGGIPVGIYLHSNGVLVSGTEEFKNDSGQNVCPAKDKIEKGDYIVEVNGRSINSKSQLSNIIKNNGCNSLILKINRNDEEFTCTLKAEKNTSGDYMLGIWVKDDDQGIGTLTYIDSNGEFGLLGHGITDTETNELISSDNGLLYKTNIWGIKKGVSGDPGALMGSIDYREENIIGNIETNTNVGVFGSAGEELLNECNIEPMDIGFKQEVKKGKAYIRCCIDGEIKDYEIRILKIDTSGNNRDKSMLIKVTDEELIEKTGGIVQGMSGSPIIQNEKIIGAVTHVLVDEPTKGYGIFIENMLGH